MFADEAGQSDRFFTLFFAGRFSKARCSQMAWSVNPFSGKVIRGLIRAVEKKEPTLVHADGREDRDDLSSCS